MAYGQRVVLAGNAGHGSVVTLEHAPSGRALAGGLADHGQ